jgi:quercetin dioxygenase-like cupin family protein
MRSAPDPMHTSVLRFSDFEATAHARGFDEVAVRTWPAGTVLDAHGHPFSVRALVVQGEMWLTLRGATRHLGPGEVFEIDRDEPHAERYGAEGATYWAARRNAAA